ncbi:MAG: CRISPR-associated protein Csm7 [Alphaproteobacteria bacterium CG_4_10_14_0_2_um_filter_63_37]|nr:MAG: hypothetical protein AUJ55_07150 [Proteobacteria bacterium CG1_02_64_396]PJA23658.1 MAG: CRISPR-associated protein Csm7 [Alphaproteobacteria bacterium CG_4_10_14_0_2_um_filter_63_37]
MRTFTTRLTPQSPFGTLLKGDTLFGQLCWAIHNRWGNERLSELLDGYTAGRPFVVLADALPAGHWPRPNLPGHWFTPLAQEDRKAAKRRMWLPHAHFATPVADWLHHCVADDTLPGGAPQPHPHPHNSIDRRSNTTGDGFAPYTLERHWYGKDAQLDLHLVLDQSRLSAADLEQALRDIGELGFGRDAGIGLGRFKVAPLEEAALPSQEGANAWLTLAPCAPQGLAWNAARCFYQPFTRFGRHGDVGVHRGNPFKTPVLLANSDAVLSPAVMNTPSFIGQGLGGEGSLSKAIRDTVHQGYTPVLGIKLPKGGHKT